MMPWNRNRHGQYVQFPIHKLIVIRFVPRSLPTRCVCIHVVSLFGWVILDVMLAALSDCSFVRLSISFYHSPFFFRPFSIIQPSISPILYNGDEGTHLRPSIVLKKYERSRSLCVLLIPGYEPCSVSLDFSNQCRYKIACNIQWRK